MKVHQFKIFFVDAGNLQRVESAGNGHLWQNWYCWIFFL